MKKNVVLENYIIETYGSVAKYLKKEKFPQQDLSVAVHKEDFFKKLVMGIKICGALKIDAAKLFCENEILVIKTEEEIKLEESLMSTDKRVEAAFMRLGEEERRKVLDYAELIFEQGDGS